MVDEEEYRRTFNQVVTSPCPFEKAIFRRVCSCRRAEKTNIAEREVVNCRSADAQRNCVEFLHHLRRRANFALGMTRTPGALPHAKAIKIQCGGLLGLQQTLDPFVEEPRVSDVHALVGRALKRFENISDVPYDKIVRFVHQYQVRVRARSRRTSNERSDV